MTLQRILRLVTVVAVVALGLHTEPASARTAGTFAFVAPGLVGSCPSPLGTGLGYPAVVGPITGGLPNLTAETCDFAFGAFLTCVNVVANNGKSGKGAAVAGPGCSMTVMGTMTGFCAVARGDGTGAFTDSAGNTITITSFTYTEVGGVAAVSGSVLKLANGQAGLMYGVVNVIYPTFAVGAGGSCLSGNATALTLVGSLSFVLG